MLRVVAPPVRLRQLQLADLRRLGEIDRSEHQQVRYSVVDGRLVSRPFSFEVPGWDRHGSGDHSVTGLIRFAQPIVARGGEFLGAFVAEELAGCAILEATFDLDTAWLALLHVSRAYRRRGVASTLWKAAAEQAGAAGAGSIYVSATPSDSAVGFYLSRGCRLATPAEIVDELFDREPDDIHLICDL
jgi:GNAT superfamily N-acetyltransferase